MYYSRHDTGLDTSTRLPRERTAYPPAGFNPYPLTVPRTPPSSNPPLSPSPAPSARCVSLFQPSATALLSPSLGNCYRTIQPRMQIAALSRVSRMTFDEIRFRGKEKETRMSLSRSLPLLHLSSLPSTLFLLRIHLLLLLIQNPFLRRDDDEKSTPSPLPANLSNGCTIVLRSGTRETSKQSRAAPLF